MAYVHNSYSIVKAEAIILYEHSMVLQCILAYPDLDYPNPHLSELQINEIHSNFSVQ